jgi:hypothetical protein
LSSLLEIVHHGLIGLPTHRPVSLSQIIVSDFNETILNISCHIRDVMGQIPN